MKYIINNIKIFFIAIFAICVSSCSDFLDKNPLDQISSETFWRNEKEVDMALAGVYNRLNSWTFRHKDGSLDVMAGDAYGTVISLAQGLIEPTSGSIINTIYNDCYRGISSCNFFLDNVEKAPLDPARLDVYKAEVLFLRALFYFTLTEFYGGVPLYDHSVTIDEAIVKQSAKATVIAQVINDLDFAIEHLDNIPYSDGHAVKGSALTLKAKVLLHQEKWQEAADVADEVIQDKIFTLHDDFRTLFLATGQNDNPEIIFSTRFLNPNFVSDLDIRFSWHGILNPLQQLVDAYECTDGQPITSSPLYDPSDWKLNRDPRLIMTIKGYTDKAYNSAGEEVVFNYNNISASQYNPVKYCNWDALPIDYSTQSEQDWIHLRYADVLLMYAEAKNEASGPDQSVYDAVNEVRTRTGVDMPELPLGLTKDEMRDRIRNERRVEFALEGTRYSDVKRWKTIEDYVPTIQDPGGVMRVFDPSKHYLFPFPQDERDINPLLDQNPNYPQ